MVDGDGGDPGRLSEEAVGDQRDVLPALAQDELPDGTQRTQEPVGCH